MSLFIVKGEGNSNKLAVYFLCFACCLWRRIQTIQEIWRNSHHQGWFTNHTEL